MIEEDEETNVTSNTNTPDFATPEKQEARAFLRERFLRVVTGIVGKRAEFHLHENTCVSGEFKACNVDSTEIIVKNLETPLGIVPNAILRCSDIIYLKINDIDINQ